MYSLSSATPLWSSRRIHKERGRAIFDVIYYSLSCRSVESIRLSMIFYLFDFQLYHLFFFKENRALLWRSAAVEHWLFSLIQTAYQGGPRDLIKFLIALASSFSRAWLHHSVCKRLDSDIADFRLFQFTEKFSPFFLRLGEETQYRQR